SYASAWTCRFAATFSLSLPSTSAIYTLSLHDALPIYALAQRLRELIRTTDLFMRDDDEYCWLLLPQTPPGGVAILLERIAALGAAATPEEGLRIELATASFTSADAGAGSTNARLIMGTLRSRVS